jgi:hypothetical protein
VRIVRGVQTIIRISGVLFGITLRIFANGMLIRKRESFNR